MRVPPLHTERLLIREFTIGDLHAVHQLLDIDLAASDLSEPMTTRAERRRWLLWTMLAYEYLPKLRQPPYGDRAIILKNTGALVGACGFVPCLAPFGQIPEVGQIHERGQHTRNVAEFGLFWAIAPIHQQRGYATEAAQALVAYAFTALNVRRLVAMTTHDNTASMSVMRKLGMRLERNPLPDPPWLQVVGQLEAPDETAVRNYDYGNVEPTSSSALPR